MSGTTDTSEITDVRSRRAFLDREILRRSQTLEMELEFASNLLWPRFVAPIPTAEMECVLRPRGRQAKSSHQKHPILLQSFQAFARMLVG